MRESEAAMEIREGSPTRRQLLDAAVAHAADHGVSDLSLRQLASALGTSHRMLIYHFGSKEGLLTEIVRTVEARQRARLAALVATGDLSSQESLAQLWEHFADEALWPLERLFFEVYAHALQGRPHAQGLLEEAVDTWVDPITDLLVAQGTPPTHARDDARLMLAVTRGLLLDLLATEDRAGVDAAMHRFAALVRPPAEPRTNERTPTKPASGRSFT
jgi:AcrR family transcriptional regulator